MLRIVDNVEKYKSQIQFKINTRIAAMNSRNVSQHLQRKKNKDLYENSVIGIIERNECHFVDPFRRMVYFNTKVASGFPDRPKRGIETITYILKGKLKHEDSLGKEPTIIGPGFIQYMLAGSGIKHCDVAYGESEVHALQLWIDLSADNMIIKPEYGFWRCGPFKSSVEYDGVHKRNIMEQPTKTPIIFLEFKLDKDTDHWETIPDKWNAFIYILSGQASFGPEDAEVGEYTHQSTLFLNNIGNGIRVQTSRTHECCFVLIAGKPHGLPLIQFAGFVITEEEAIEDVVSNYKAGRGVFQDVSGWNSDYVMNR